MFAGVRTTGENWRKSMALIKKIAKEIGAVANFSLLPTHPEYWLCYPDERGVNFYEWGSNVRVEAVDAHQPYQKDPLTFDPSKGEIVTRNGEDQDSYNYFSLVGSTSTENKKNVVFAYESGWANAGYDARYHVFVWGGPQYLLRGYRGWEKVGIIPSHECRGWSDSRTIEWLKTKGVKIIE